MHAKIFSATTIGVNAHLIEVEADLAFGLMNFCIVGLPDKAIKESKDRIRAALKNSGLKLPDRLITINLAPADIRKQNILFDVPIAIAILQAGKMLTMSKGFVDETVFLGELSLDGSIRPVRGALCIAHGAKTASKKRLVVPQENVAEAATIQGIEVVGVRNLADLVSYLCGELKLSSGTTPQVDHVQKLEGLDFSQVKGQWQAKRALQLAAAGGHNILFIGPPGAGKTMLAKRFATIMPKLNLEQSIQTTKVYSVAGLLGDNNLICQRPFRSPHHTVSQVGLAGGGSNPIPGEISLAHNGILFLDELTEFNRSTIEVLRQPLESGSIVISRAGCTVEYPAKFLLIAALNPCPCGYFGDSSGRCNCSHHQIEKYLGKLSGPLLDRIDIHVNVTSVKYDDLSNTQPDKKSSEVMQQEISQALEMKTVRKQTASTAKLNTTEINQFCQLEPTAEQILQKYFTKFNMSARSYHKVLKVARTIADFAQSDKIQVPHIQEAIMYRSLDKKKL